MGGAAALAAKARTGQRFELFLASTPFCTALSSSKQDLRVSCNTMAPHSQQRATTHKEKKRRSSSTVSSAADRSAYKQAHSSVPSYKHSSSPNKSSAHSCSLTSAHKNLWDAQCGRIGTSATTTMRYEPAGGRITTAITPHHEAEVSPWAPAWRSS